MPEKSVSALPRELRDLYNKGTQALTRQNFEYAIAILNQVLVKEPSCFECRQALRAAQFKNAGNSGGFFKKMLGGASSSPAIAKAQMSLRKDPIEAIQTLEQVLDKDPSNSAAHKLLAEAALAADFPKTACFSYEIVLKNSPKDYQVAMDYAQALARAGQAEKAETVLVDLQRAFPHKGEISQALKDISARKTLSEGYDQLADGQGSYRDILRNKEEAVSLEQENRQVKTEAVADRLIREYTARLAQEPRNIKLMRDLAELYAQKKDFDKALEYCQKIKSTEGGNDPSFEQFTSDITLKRFDYSLTQLDTNAADYADCVARIEAERQAFQLEECKNRAERYPTDLQIRFELGELYFKAGKVNEALAEFQKAQANPNRRIQAMAYLGQCFARKGMNDMAARRLQEAIKEKPVFDEEKKELLYQLGSVLEKMGKTDEAIEQFKQVYEADIGYKDVSAKVDAYYAAKA
ncbi:MAG TPA: tetratricopeptide repeat protein [Verrucomicrobiae bacterium]|nr:tetratricopeptide repeat protein [Verrucomicrobiae bacterium]